MKRILEPEIISEDEIRAYDSYSNNPRQDLIYDCFAQSVVNMGVAEGKGLDLGTGRASIPIKVAQKLPRLTITAIDLSQHMLNIAQDNVKKEKVSKQVKIEYADMKHLPYESNSFDLVFSHNSIHHIPDPQLVFSEINRVLKPKGALMVRDVRRPANLLTMQIITGIFGRSLNKRQKKTYKASLMAALTPSEFDSMANRVGLSEYKLVNYFPAYVGIERKSGSCQGNEGLPTKPNTQTNWIDKLIIRLYTSK